ncbi:hypothetical protein OC834_001355 [Tilletia horrida]|nr:hypothetical protein OC835_005270 [Tilletia horrida]KAK0535911.1 hypothetical protein OC834_001355 [Tilletia horrida]
MADQEEDEAILIPAPAPAEDAMLEDAAPAAISDGQQQQQSTRRPSSSKRTQPSAAGDVETSQAPAAKRPRRDAEARSRGMRMFGLVTSTLKKVANENEKRMTGEAGKRRAEIEERLKQKLQRETDELEARASQEQQDRADLAELSRITNAIALGEADFRVRKAQKRRLASFLCAKVDVSDSTVARRDGGGSGSGRGAHRAGRAGADNSEYLSTADYAIDLPFGLEPLREGALYPIYYLPTKLLPSQEDELDEQEDRVDRLIDDAETEWRERKKGLEERSKLLRDRIRARRGTKTEQMQIDDRILSSSKTENGDTKVKAEEEEEPAENRGRAEPSTEHDGDVRMGETDIKDADAAAAETSVEAAIPS